MVAIFYLGARVIKMVKKILSKVMANDHRSLVVVQFMFV